MAQIVKSSQGYWVSKEVYPGEHYISFDDIRFQHPTEKLEKVAFHELEKDINTHMSVQISMNTDERVVLMLARELCNAELGMLYALEYRAPFGVRKIVDPPVL